MRAKMVTRSITVTNATVLAVNKASGATADINITLAGKFKSDEALLRKANKENTDANTQLLYVKTTSVSNLLYGVSESEFLAIAKPLDPNTRKPIGGVAEVDTEETED